MLDPAVINGAINQLKYAKLLYEKPETAPQAIVIMDDVIRVLQNMQ